MDVVQTFLPYPSFVESVRVLDDRRLGKQRVEALQVTRALLGMSKGWTNHPAVRMWRGHLGSLRAYVSAVCREWPSRGFRDTCEEKVRTLVGDAPDLDPPWLGLEALHSSHRSNLLRKDPVHYGSFGWTEPSTLPYVWPA